MLIVINDCCGGFGLSKAAALALGYEKDSLWEARYIPRSDPDLIKMVLKDPYWAADGVASLVVVEVPDKATDWKIIEHDGAETVVYVLNGKIFDAEER